jgi:hypothetical protein
MCNLYSQEADTGDVSDLDALLIKGEIVGTGWSGLRSKPEAAVI